MATVGTEKVEGQLSSQATGRRSVAILETKGIAPVQQARSKATLNALLEAGLKIVEEKDVALTPVGEIAARAGVSVGAFYERFKTKDVFFSALQEVVATEIEASVRGAVGRTDFVDLDAHAAIARVAGTWLVGIRAHRGLVRATLRHLPENAEVWFPLARLGQTMCNIYLDVLRARLPKKQHRDVVDNTRVAIQLVHGAIVNIILNDPGPLRLDDRRLLETVCRTISLFVGLEATSRRNAAAKRTGKIR